METISKYCQISILNQNRDLAISIDKYFWGITSLSTRKLYITCLAYSYPIYLRHPFVIIYLANFCEASSDSFFLPSSDELPCEIDSRNLSINFTNFDNRYERLSNFTLKQTFNLTPLSNNELDKLALENPEFKMVLFQNVNKVLQEMNEKYPFVMSNWLVIVKKTKGNYSHNNNSEHNLVLKSYKATVKVRHFSQNTTGKLRLQYQLITSFKH